VGCFFAVMVVRCAVVIMAAGVAVAVAVPGAIGVHMLIGAVLTMVVSVIDGLAVDLDFPRSATASGTHGILLISKSLRATQKRHPAETTTVIASVARHKESVIASVARQSMSAARYRGLPRIGGCCDSVARRP
jgi:hypothetical protein